MVVEAANVISFPELRTMRTLPEAVTLLDEWRMHAERMEMLYDLACIQRDWAEALLRLAEAEIERLRAACGDAG